MKRGEIWTISGGTDYAGKPRPAVVLQSDDFEFTRSVTVCALTTSGGESPMFRPSIAPDPGNGLRSISRLMVDKITTLPKSKVGRHLGQLRDEDIVRLNRAIMVFLGLAGSPA